MKHSFPPGTRVLLADGTSKPIEQVELGDRVLAADPETGRTVPRKVVATWVHDDEPERTEVTIDTDGAAGGETATLTGTDWHPVWEPKLGAWVPLGNLRTGSWLQTSSGTWVQATAVRKYHGTGKVHDLSVEDAHTYHVLAGAVATLVHNCGPDRVDADAAPAPGIVWRALAEGEDPALGLTARAPDVANASPLSHVAGLQQSPWISTSKIPSVAFDKYNSGHGVVAVDLDRVTSRGYFWRIPW